MADRRPPQRIGGERKTLMELLQFQREAILRKVEGIDEADADRRFVDSGTTLRWLVIHLCMAESVWVERRVAGGEAIIPPDDTPLAEAVAAYRATWSRVDAILDGVSFDDLCAKNETTPPVDVRWVVAHLLEETARHAGHADILRELIDGSTGR